MRLADLWLDGVDLPAVRRGLRRGVEPRGVGRGHPAGLEGAGRPGRRARRRGHGRRPARGDAGHGRPAARHDALDGRRDVRHSRSGRPWACWPARSSAPPTSACRSARPARPRCCRSTSRRSARAWASRKDEVRLYLALREAAHQRLFAHVPWLRSHLFGAVEGYARGIKVDTAKLEDVVGQFDPHQPRGAAGGAPAGHVPAGGHPGAEGRAGPAGDRPGTGRGLGGRGGARRRQAASAVGGRAARDAAPPPGHAAAPPSRPSPP